MITINIAKAGQSIAVDFDALPQAAKDYYIAYGIRQSLNDAVAGLKREDFSSDEAFKEAAYMEAQERADNIAAGTIRSHGGRVSDPVEAETMRLAVAAVSNAILKKGGKLKDYTMKQLREKATGHLDKFRAAAEANVAARKDADIEVDL